MNKQTKHEQDRDNPLIDVLADWLVAQALRDVPINSIFENTCKQIYAAGIPLTRAHVTFRVLHPLFRSQSVVWNHGKDKVDHENYLYGGSREPWFQSPLYHMVSNQLTYLRRRLTGAGAMLDFPVLKELAERGMIDYLGFMVPFSEGPATRGSDEVMEWERAAGIVGSWATDRSSGFTNSDLRALRRIEQRLAVAFKINIQNSITQNILSAYVGPIAGDKVLNGQIQLGDLENIHSVIWFCDLRDSTRLADALAGDKYLHILNDYFKCTAGAVLEHGGDVLKFIGDAVLAIFPIDERRNKKRACESAVGAANAALKNLEAINAEYRSAGRETINFGLALHVGELQFGNIGTPERLDFTVIGPAVNEATRLEALTKILKYRVLVSDIFAESVDLDWIPLGEHCLKGVGELVNIHALPE